jgi:hypothetical protein
MRYAFEGFPSKPCLFSSPFSRAAKRRRNCLALAPEVSLPKIPHRQSTTASNSTLRCHPDAQRKDLRLSFGSSERNFRIGGDRPGKPATLAVLLSHGSNRGWAVIQRQFRQRTVQTA